MFEVFGAVRSWLVLLRRSACFFAIFLCERENTYVRTYVCVVSMYVVHCIHTYSPKSFEIQADFLLQVCYCCAMCALSLDDSTQHQISTVVLLKSFGSMPCHQFGTYCVSVFISHHVHVRNHTRRARATATPGNNITTTAKAYYVVYYYDTYVKVLCNQSVAVVLTGGYEWRSAGTWRKSLFSSASIASLKVRCPLPIHISHSQSNFYMIRIRLAVALEKSEFPTVDVFGASSQHLVSHGMGVY